MLADVMSRNNINYYVVSQSGRSTINLFERVRTIYRNLPISCQVGVLEFSGSRIIFGTGSSITKLPQQDIGKYDDKHKHILVDNLELNRELDWFRNDDIFEHNDKIIYTVTG
jgi:phage terminase large subunit-like protein